MNILWTEEANILSIHMGGEVKQTIEVRPGLFLDLNKERRIVGLETCNAQDLLEEAKRDEGATVALPNETAA